MSNSYGKTGCKDSVWDKGGIVRGKDPNTHRRDAYGNVIYKQSYGKTTPMGWNIDHIKPQAAGGSHSIRNLQPMQSNKNMSLGSSIKKKSVKK